MPSRRSHINSHHGCAQCKNRRVKCDETRPACLRCQRQGRSCVYASLGPSLIWSNPVSFVAPPPPPASASAGSTQQAQRISSPSAQVPFNQAQHGPPQRSFSPAQPQQTIQSQSQAAVAHHQNQSPSIASPSGSLAKPEPLDLTGPPTPSSNSSTTGIRISSLLSPPSPGPSTSSSTTTHQNMLFVHRQDLRLMHHWTAHTGDVVACKASLVPLWQDFFPKEALDHDFLLHAIFSLAAFHLGSTKTDHRQFYTDMAMEHHSMCLTKAQPGLHNITTHNCHALFAFSCVVAIISFASPHLTAVKPRDPLREIVEGFYLWRGCNTVVESCYQAVAEGPMRALFYHPNPKSLELLPQEIKDALQVLQARCNQLSDAEPDVRVAWTHAIECMHTSFADCCKRSADDVVDNSLFGWPIMVSTAFIDSLWRSEPMAVAIIAHYAVMLHGSKNVWWASNWGPELVGAADRLLDASWDECMKWPRKKVRG